MDVKDLTGRRKLTVSNTGLGFLITGTTLVTGTVFGMLSGFVDNPAILNVSFSTSSIFTGVGFQLLALQSVTDANGNIEPITDDDVKLGVAGSVLFGLPFIVAPILYNVLPDTPTTTRLIAGSALGIPVGLSMMMVAMSRLQ
jgi:hypothetical protein